LSGQGFRAKCNGSVSIESDIEQDRGQRAIVPESDSLRVRADMKVMIELSKPLLREAKEFAKRNGISLSTLVEQGLRKVVPQRKSKKRFRLRLVTVGGDWLRPELRNASWDEILDLSYGDRGGQPMSPKPGRRK
jgi:hypothetical protein